MFQTFKKHGRHQYGVEFEALTFKNHGKIKDCYLGLAKKHLNLT